MIDLDKLQGMWEKDSKIDMDNLHTESTNIPTLHAKYFELYNTVFLLRKIILPVLCCWQMLWFVLSVLFYVCMCLKLEN